MALQQQRQRGLQPLGREVGRHGQQETLVVVLALRSLQRQEPALDGRERHAAIARNVLGGAGQHHRPSVLIQQRHESGHRLRGRVHQLRQRDGQPLPVGPRNHLDGKNGVPAQLEKALVRPHLGNAQHLGPDRRQPRAGVACSGVGGRRWRRRPCRLRRQLPAQCLAVDLAAVGERELVQLHEIGGNHVRRQAGRQVRAQRLGADGVRGPHEGRQPVIGLAVRNDQHRCGLHARVGGQRSLDFAQLDAQAAQLDLVVVAACKVHAPIGQAPAPVARAVQPLAGVAERILHKAGRRQPGTPQVAPRQPCTADVQLPRRPRGQQAHVLVQHMQLHVRQRPSNGQPVGALHALLHADSHRSFGRSIGIEKAPAHRPPQRQLRCTGLAGHHQQAQRIKRGRIQGGKHRGRQRCGGDAMAPHKGLQLWPGPCHVRGRHQQRRPMAPGHGHLPDGGVKGQRGELQHAIASIQREHALLGMGQGAHARPRIDHALGRARGAGRIDHIGRGRGLRLGKHSGLGSLVWRHGAEQLLRREAAQTQFLRHGQRGIGQHQHCAAVLQHEALALRRQRRVDGHKGCARAQDCGNCRQADGRAAQAQGHTGFLPCAQGRQRAGRLARQHRQLRIVHATVRPFQGRGAGRVLRPVVDPVHQKALVHGLDRAGAGLQGIARLLGRELQQRAQCLTGLRRHGGKQCIEVRQQAARCRSRHLLAVAVQCQAPSVRALHAGQGEQEVRALMAGDCGQAQTTGLQRIGRRIVLHQNQGLEQIAAWLQFRSLADFRQRCGRMLLALQVVLLQRGQPREQRHAGSHTHTRRHRGDQHADHLLHVSDVGRAPRHGHTEHQVAAAAVARQQQCPGGLQHDAGRGTRGAGQRGQGAAGGRRQQAFDRVRSLRLDRLPGLAQKGQ